MPLHNGFHILAFLQWLGLNHYASISVANGISNPTCFGNVKLLISPLELCFFFELHDWFWAIDKCTKPSQFELVIEGLSKPAQKTMSSTVRRNRWYRCLIFVFKSKAWFRFDPKDTKPQQNVLLQLFGRWSFQVHPPHYPKIYTCAKLKNHPDLNLNPRFAAFYFYFFFGWRTLMI